MLCVFWHRSSVELDSRHSQHSSVSLGQPCLCCQFTGYPLIDIMNTGKIPPQDVFKDALIPISELSIHWSLSLTSSGFNAVADWPQESFFIYFCSNLWPGLSSSSLDCSSPTRSPIAWFAEFFFLTRDISWRGFERIFLANKLFKPLSSWLPELSEIVKLQHFLYLLEVFSVELLKSVHFILQSVIDLLQACSSSLLHYGLQPAILPLWEKKGLQGD